MQQNRQADPSAEDGVVLVYEEFARLVRYLTSGVRSQISALTLAQHSLLAFIARNPGCLATDISEVFGVHRSTVSRQLRHAVEAGWVEAQSGPARAGHPLRLTPYGTTVLEAAVTRRVGDVRAGLSGWEHDDLARFVQLLRRFRHGVDPDTARSDSVRTSDQNDGDFSA